MSLVNNPITQTSNLGLVILDVQLGSQYLATHTFRAPNPVSFEKVIMNSQKLICAFTAQHLPIFIVTMQSKLLPAIINKYVARSLFSVDAPQVFNIVKNSASAFKQPAFRAALRETDVKHLVITGFTADDSVRKTVQDGQLNGFAATVISDAVIASTIERYTEALRSFAEVTDTDSLIAQLSTNYAS